MQRRISEISFERGNELNHCERMSDLSCCVRLCMYMHVHECVLLLVLCLYVCMCEVAGKWPVAAVHVYMCMHTCACTCTCYALSLVYMCVCVCMSSCMCVCFHVFNWIIFIYMLPWWYVSKYVSGQQSLIVSYCIFFDGQANEACRRKYLHVCYVFGQTCVFGEVPHQSETYMKWPCQLMRAHFQHRKGRKECEPAAVVIVAWSASWSAGLPGSASPSLLIHKKAMRSDKQRWYFIAM